MTVLDAPLVRPTSPTAAAAAASTVPPLEAGDNIDQPTSRERYVAMPAGTRAELIGGVVYMPSPVGRAHGIRHKAALYWTAHYERFTPGVESIDNGTAVLAVNSEPQPDVSLRIVTGGQSRATGDGYVEGCPELVCEVAHSTEAYDLHSKRRDYDRYGAKEYVAIVLREPRVVWFGRKGKRLVEVPAEPDGVYRSRAFPGLWLAPAALLSGDLNAVAAALDAGLATPEHAAFVADLATRVP